jgi:ATP-GRASP peptide maturase of grasp-with-spasm system
VILIVSETFDQSTNDVIDWLDTFGVSWQRLNGDILDDGSPVAVHIDDDTTAWKFGEAAAPMFDADVVWMRRWRTWFAEPVTPHFRGADVTADDAAPVCVRLNQFRNGELKALSASILSILATKPGLGHPLKLSLNKQRVLEEARASGFTIPRSLITNSRDAARDFQKSHGTLITKPIGEVMLVPWTGDLYASFTVRCTDQLFDELPPFFLPSLFQVEVAKAYELRVFYLAGACYAMAMFTQAAEGTSVDFRRYDVAKPSRCVPYLLPRHIEAQVRTLMNALQLDTGSLDLIVTPDDRCVFLEVNPVGQFGMTSGPCNYRLERRIAEHLRELIDGN